MKKPTMGWMFARVADFVIYIILLIVGSLVYEPARLIDVGQLLLFVGTAFIVVNVGAGFFITSLVWWFVCARQNWPPVVIAVGSMTLFQLSLFGIHLYGGDWSYARFEVFLHPIFLAAVGLHGVTTWIVASQVAR